MATIKTSRMQTFKEVRHPHDPQFRLDRQELVEELLTLSEAQLGRYLQSLALMPPIKDESGLSRKIIGEIHTTPFLPREVKGILDSTSGTTGNVLIRQDLEPVLYALFVKKFPAWERLSKQPSNGLVHAATQITTPDSSGSQGSSFISELGTIPYTTGSYNRVTFPIAVMANGRGVSLKEIAAVAQGGAPYNPQDTESRNAMTKLASDAQWAMMQGNATNSSGSPASTNELGAYNALAFDGFRGVTGSVGAFSGNGATQIDIGGSLNFMESIQKCAATINNNGAPNNDLLAFLSILSKQDLDTEQQNNVRYNTDLADLIPGVRVNTITYANGSVLLAPIPGNSIGNYNRTSDGLNVEDIYIIDESGVTVRWLYSPDFTVLQIPTAVDAQLSDRVIVFGMYGMEQASPLFSGKVRRTTS